MRLGCLELRWLLTGRPAVEREDTVCIEMACMIVDGVCIRYFLLSGIFRKQTGKNWHLSSQRIETALRFVHVCNIRDHADGIVAV